MDLGPSEYVCIQSNEIYYLKPEYLSGFCDVKIISKEKKSFYINRSVLASQSFLFAELGCETDVVMEDEIVVITEIPTSHLEKVMKHLIDGETHPELEEVIGSFADLGIRFQALNDIDLDTNYVTGGVPEILEIVDYRVPDSGTSAGVMNESVSVILPSNTPTHQSRLKRSRITIDLGGEKRLKTTEILNLSKEPPDIKCSKCLGLDVDGAECTCNSIKQENDISQKSEYHGFIGGKS